MALDALYFNKTKPFCDISPVVIDGQNLVKVPKFWYRRPTPSSGPYAGKPCLEISTDARAGFALPPAFMRDGAEIDQFYAAAYECSVDPNDSTKAASLPGRTPLTGIDFATMQTRINNRNTGGQTGWHMLNIYELAVLQMLCLIECGTADVQSKIGAGNVSSSGPVLTGSSNAVWRGIYELWGNAAHMIDGCIITLGSPNPPAKIFDRQGTRTYVDVGTMATAATTYIYSTRTDAGAGYDFKDLFIPGYTTDDLYSAPYPDQSGLAAGGTVGENRLIHGGNYISGSGAGLFALGQAPSGLAATAVGSRMAKW